MFNNFHGPLAVFLFIFLHDISLLLLLSCIVRDPGAPVGPLVNIQRYIKSKPPYVVGILICHPRDALRNGYKVHILRNNVSAC
jgi:hypothetical protein